MLDTTKRLQVLGAALVAAGLAIAGVGFLYGMDTAEDGLESAQAMYEDQGVTLNYNDDGVLVDRDSPEQAQEILALLEHDWKYPVDRANLDPADPLVNTRDELMYQYATITFHVLHGERTVTLTQEDLNESGGAIVHRGVTYDAPGDYQVQVGAYYAELDRRHPIEGQLREAWSAQALALTSYLAAGHANQSAGELASITSMGFGFVGLLFAGTGGGLFWAVSGKDAKKDEA